MVWPRVLCGFQLFRPQPPQLNGSKSMLTHRPPQHALCCATSHCVQLPPDEPQAAMDSPGSQAPPIARQPVQQTPLLSHLPRTSLEVGEDFVLQVGEGTAAEWAPKIDTVLLELRNLQLVEACPA